jgi:glutathione S-transferase
MKLYYSPGSCALGIHVLMEEIGAPFLLQRVNFAEREQFSDAFVAINSKSRVPTLQRDDGSVLTEYQAISFYLGLTHPDRGLIPVDAERKCRMLELMDYVVGTIHGAGFRRVFRTADFAPSEADHEAVRAKGLEIAKAGFALIDRDLAEKQWIAGDFSVADPALFYPCYWAVQRVKIDLPAHVRSHYDRMLARPPVAKALKDEGL